MHVIPFGSENIWLIGSIPALTAYGSEFPYAALTVVSNGTDWYIINTTTGISAGDGIQLSQSGNSDDWAINPFLVGANLVVAATNPNNPASSSLLQAGAQCNCAGGPYKASGNVLLEKINMYCNEFTTGTIDVIAYVYVSDAAGTNTLEMSLSTTITGPQFGSNIAVTGFSSPTIVGSDLSLGSPQTSNLVHSSGGTIPYWITVTLYFSNTGIS
jgi:hypothetical protein